MLTALLFVGCSRSPDSVRSEVARYLEDRYGETFEVTLPQRTPRGLEGAEAEFYTWKAQPKGDTDREFEGSVDYDVDPPVFTEPYPCVRDQERVALAMEAALDALDGRVMNAVSACNPEVLQTIDPRERGAAFSWTARVSVFPADGALEGDAMALFGPLRAAVAEHHLHAVNLQLDVHERGAQTVRHYREEPLTPQAQMWYLGTLLLDAPDAEPRIMGQPTRAPGVESEAREWLGKSAVPEGAVVDVRVFATDLSVSKVVARPDARITDLDPGVLSGLKQFVTLGIRGTPETHTEVVNAWLERFYAQVPRTRAYPMTYVLFYGDTDPRPLSEQPDKLVQMWLVNQMTGIAVAKVGMGESTRPITSLPYGIPPD